MGFGIIEVPFRITNVEFITVCPAFGNIMLPVALSGLGHKQKYKWLKSQTYNGLMQLGI